MRYRKSNKLYYWIGCIDFYTTYVYTAEAPAGPWTQRSQSPGGQCFYDCGLLIDDDDSMYVVYGSTNVSVARLTDDGFNLNFTQPVVNAGEVQQDVIEGNRMYKRNGFYYILDDHPGTTTYVWKSKSPFGPYTSSILANNVPSPVDGAGVPHQGSLIETPGGQWYYMSFTWAYPSGRLPVLAPITWNADDFPVLVTDASGAWGRNYTFPNASTALGQPSAPASWTGTDQFNGTTLGPAWEWNHNPNTTKYTVNNGVTLSTATITNDLYRAKNTLTHRVHGEFPRGTVRLDIRNMTDGDVAGLSAFRDWAASIQIVRTANGTRLEYLEGMQQNQTSWDTVSTGNVTATAGWDMSSSSSSSSSSSNKGEIWLRVEMDARAAGSRAANISYSGDGRTFTRLGGTFTMTNDYYIFMGYRFAIFNYATKARGESVKVLSFESV